MLDVCACVSVYSFLFFSFLVCVFMSKYHFCPKFFAFVSVEVKVNVNRGEYVYEWGISFVFLPVFFLFLFYQDLYFSDLKS